MARETEPAEVLGTPQITPARSPVYDTKATATPPHLAQAEADSAETREPPRTEHEATANAAEAPDRRRQRTAQTNRRGHGDSIIATAILDRLLHHSTTVNIRGESYRLWFLEGGTLNRRQAQRDGRYGVLRMVRPRPDNGSGDPGLGKQPCWRKLRAGNTTLLSGLVQAVHDLLVGRFGLRVHLLPELVGFVALGTFALPGAGQAATSKWAFSSPVAGAQ
jgi:IstB-like ATP binding protein